MKSGFTSQISAETIKNKSDLQNNAKEFKSQAERTSTFPVVSIEGNEYLVDFGPDSKLRFHRVNKNRRCSCGDAACKAIDVIRIYLQTGDARAPDPGEYPLCPICGSKTFQDRNWDGKYTKKRGWTCSEGGLQHFLAAKANRIQQNFVTNHWLFPPVPGYPGVRWEELITQEECEALHKKIFLETGYDPRR